MDCVLKTFVMESGERYNLLTEKLSGLPLYYPSLYVTTQIRNRSLSLSAMESTLSGISVLMRYLDECGVDIELKFLKREFFQESEFDAIRDYCQIDFRSRTIDDGNNSLFSLAELQEFDKNVSSETEYLRLSVISLYSKWLAGQIICNLEDRFTVVQIGKMEKGFKSRRPVRKKRNTESNEKGLTKEQLDLLFEIFRPESEFNPFNSKSLRIRNRLIFLILYHLGIRGGELLNIRIRDFDFGVNQLVIFRRADEKDDPRKFQPLVKTHDRRLPMKDTLAKEIHLYISNERKMIPNANRNDFLFITHKAGPTQGQPLSKSGYKKVMDVVRHVSPSLFNLTGHALRYAWNEAFSNLMDSMDEAPSQEEQEKMRSYLMGWKEGSGTGETYNKRFIRRKANEVAMNLQIGMIRLPKGVNNG